MDFSKVYDKAKKDLDLYKEKATVLRENIKQKANLLSLEVDENLVEKLEKLKKNTEAEKAECESAIEKMVKELESINLSVDE